MLAFEKYSGAGNDFALVEAGELARALSAGTSGGAGGASSEPGELSRRGAGRDRPGPGARELARRLCPRSTGLGVDGLALTSRVDRSTLRVRFFNPDGSEFATCGNGSRCVALRAVERGRVEGPAFRLLTAGGPVEARVDEGGEISLLYRLAAGLAGERELETGRGSRTGWLVRMGTPHFVLRLPELPEGGIGPLARPIRHHPALGPEGANVNLVEVVDRETLRIRTFERGVEAETLACGAGSMSAVLALHAAGACAAGATLETRSGARLRVTVETTEDPAEIRERRIGLAGPARFVLAGRYPWPPESSAGAPGAAAGPVHPGAPGDGDG